MKMTCAERDMHKARQVYWYSTIHTPLYFKVLHIKGSEINIKNNNKNYEKKKKKKKLYIYTVHTHTHTQEYKMIIHSAVSWDVAQRSFNKCTAEQMSFESDLMFQHIWSLLEAGLL